MKFGSGNEYSGGNILKQMRRLGDTLDWDRLYFTMNDDLAKVVVDCFVDLYEKGLIYRGRRLVNWDPKLQTSVSDLEVEPKEQDGHLWEIRYPAADGSEGVGPLQRLVRKLCSATKLLRSIRKTNAIKI